MTKLPFEFLHDLVLRSPYFSYEDYATENLVWLLQNDFFKLALFLASADFYERLAIKGFSIALLTDKERTTLFKYYNRMSFRPTPFGTFSSFSTLTWQNLPTDINLAAPDSAKVILLIDQAAVKALSKILLDPLPPECLFKCNNTLYLTNKEYRYIKMSVDEETGKASYLLESFEANRFSKNLIQFLKDKPATYHDIIVYIKTSALCTEAEADEYLHFFINGQIISPQMEVTLLGKDYLNELTGNPTLKSPLRLIVKKILNRLLTITFPNLPAVQSAVGNLDKLFIHIELPKPKQWFYANLHRPVYGSIDIAHQQQLTDALNCLYLLTPAIQPPMLADFITKFKNRFDLQKIPLLIALDPETGLSYGGSGSSILANPLLQDMHFDQPQSSVDNIGWSATHKLLLQKWNSSALAGKHIVLEKSDLQSLKANEAVPMPPSIPVMFRLHSGAIVIEAAGGVSATSLIGRFTLLNEDVAAISKKIAGIEQSNNPQIIFAEINQLSDTHTDNINRRLPVYDYEIAVNVPPTLLPDKQLHLDDLMLSVVNNQLILESSALQKRVIPRLSTAYNFNQNQLSLFKFLGDLQHDGVRSNFGLDLEKLFPGLTYYPRVTYQQTILCLAKWHISDKEVNYLLQGNINDGLKKLHQMGVEKGWPKHVVLSRSDQQLVFNLEIAAEAQLFLDSVKAKGNITVVEYLGNYSNQVKSHEGMPMVNQFIAFLVSMEPSYFYTPAQANLTDVDHIREFMAGSRWIYLKIYCSPGRTNDLLSKKILPLLRKANKGEITSWFFIRYIDTAPHIRLRIQVKEDCLGSILITLKSKLTADVHYQVIHEYQANIYRRELERYGADIINQVEKVFEASSNMVINYVKLATAEKFKYAYHSLAFVSVANIIRQFFPDLTSQINFTQRMAESFYREHTDLKALKFALDKKYRSLKDEIYQLVENDADYYKQLKLLNLSLLLTKSIQHMMTGQEAFTEQRKVQLAADLIHMHLNRIFQDEPRYQELIVYYCLGKHFQSVLARAGRSR